jgi:RNA polymerase sigma factor (sigma-70 family)
VTEGARRTARAPLNAAQRTLVEDALGLVERVARAVLRRHPGARLDELESSGFEALAEAARTYDPAKNDNFAAYAWSHVYGAMADQLAVSASAGTAAVAVARRLGLDLAGTLRDESDPFSDGPADVEQRVRDACDDVTAAVVFGIGRDLWSELGEDAVILREDYRRAAAAVHRELSRLSEHDRRLIELRYRDRLALRRVADALGISKSSAARRCAAMLVRLRDALALQGITSVPRV